MICFIRISFFRVFSIYHVEYGQHDATRWKGNLAKRRTLCMINPPHNPGTLETKMRKIWESRENFGRSREKCNKIDEILRSLREFVANLKRWRKHALTHKNNNIVVNKFWIKGDKNVIKSIIFRENQESDVNLKNVKQYA